MTTLSKLILSLEGDFIITELYITVSLMKLVTIVRFSFSVVTLLIPVTALHQNEKGEIFLFTSFQWQLMTTHVFLKRTLMTCTWAHTVQPHRVMMEYPQLYIH